MAVEISEELYLEHLAEAPEQKIVKASYWDKCNRVHYTQDWKHPKYSWTLFVYRPPNVGGYGIRYARCKNTGVCRHTVIDEHYNKTPLETRKEAQN